MDAPSRRPTTTFSASCCSATTSAPRMMWTPSSLARASSTCSVPLCGTMRIIGNRVSSSRRFRLAPGAGWMSCTGTPRATRSSASPRASSSSRVRACTAKALVVFGSAVRWSSSWQPTPASASSHASMRPVGPAPTTITSVERAAFSGSGKGAMTVSLGGVRVVRHHPRGRSTRGGGVQAGRPRSGRTPEHARPPLAGSPRPACGRAPWCIPSPC